MNGSSNTNRLVMKSSTDSGGGVRTEHGGEGGVVVDPIPRRAQRLAHLLITTLLSHRSDHAAGAN